MPDACYQYLCKENQREAPVLGVGGGLFYLFFFFFLCLIPSFPRLSFHLHVQLGKRELWVAVGWGRSSALAAGTISRLMVAKPHRWG